MKFFSCLLLLFLILVSFSSAQDYLVGSGDILKITVYDNDDLTTTVRVSGEGTIVVPLLGRIKVDNLSIPQISKKLNNLYADGYLVNPQVNVFIQEYRGQKVVILGQVNQPGIIELQGTTTLLELISQAGGLTANAGDKAIIKRKEIKSNEKRPRVITINLIALIEKGDISKNILILDGDNIYIDRAGLFYVTGEVARPNAYRLNENTTVLKAITLAGGYSERADKTKTKIHRKIDGKTKIITSVKPDTQVLENDILVVPESFW